jgi:hypothetical protein
MSFVSVRRSTLSRYMTEAQKGSGGIPILNIDLGCGRELSGQRHAPAVLPPAKRAGAHCTTGWGRYGQFRKISLPTGVRNVDRQTPYKVGIPPAQCLPLLSTSQAQWNIIFTVAPCISKIHLSLHTNKCTKFVFYLNSVLIIHINTLYSFVTPTCFDTLCVIIREHTFFLAKITD